MVAVNPPCFKYDHGFLGFADRFGEAGEVGDSGVAVGAAGGACGAVCAPTGEASLGVSARAFLMNPCGTVAVRMARSRVRSTFRVSKNAFTSTSVPCIPTLPSAE